MSVTVQALVGANAYTLSGRNPYAFISLTGLGLPPVRRIKERGPQQLGSTDVGFLLDERMLNLALMIVGESLSDLDQYRDDLSEILKPLSSTPIKLRITRDNGSVRQIDCYTVGMVDFPNTLQERMGASQLVVAQFEAADPIPYNPTLRNIIFSVGTSIGGFQVPVEVPVAHTGGSAIDAIENLVYAGKWEVFPRIFVTGPADDLVITNETTGRVLDFTGTTISGGDTWEIDLRYGAKTVRDGNGDLQNAALSDESDLVTWSIVPPPVAVGGINDIRVEVPSGADENTSIRMEYYDRYPSMG